MLVSEYEARLATLDDDLSKPTALGTRLATAIAAFQSMIDESPGAIPESEQARLLDEYNAWGAAVNRANGSQYDAERRELSPRSTLSMNPTDTMSQDRVVELMELTVTANRLLREISGYTVRKKPSYGPIILGMGVLAGAVGFAVWASNRKSR